MSDQLKRQKTNRILYIISLLTWTAVAFILSEIVIAMIMSLILGERIMQPVWTATYDFLVYVSAFSIVVFLPPRIFEKVLKNSKLSKEFSTTPEEMGVKAWPTLTDLGLVPIAYIIYILLAQACTHLMQIFSWFDSEQAQNVGFNVLSTGFDRIVAILALVIFAPLFEELLLRGWLFGKLRNKVGFAATMLCVSLLFAILHGQWNVGVTTFCLSIVLCSLREITGSVWSGVLVHMLNNGIAFYLLYIVGIS